MYVWILFTFAPAFVLVFIAFLVGMCFAICRGAFRFVDWRRARAEKAAAKAAAEEASEAVEA